MIQAIQQAIDELDTPSGDEEWAVCVRDEQGAVIAARNAGATLSIASAGKVLLLIETARQLDEGLVSPRSLLTRVGSPPMEEAGIWQHLHVDSLPLADVAVLIASASDNLATNVLLDHIGLEKVGILGASLGLERTALLDRCRRQRSDTDPPRLASGSCDELSMIMSRIHNGLMVSRSVSCRVEAWLAMNADLSMVAAAFGLDPLAHTTRDHEMTLRNKTGGDTGVLADVGFIRGPAGTLSYAVITNWSTPDLKDTILNRMRTLGERLRDHIAPVTTTTHSF